MKKRIHILGLVLLFAAFSATSALALTANQTYTVQLSTVAANGQMTPITGAETTTTADANGMLNFQFNNVPDTGTTPFLMVQIMETVNGQQQVVRQTLVPAPKAGQALQMGVNEATYRQTQAALQAMRNATGSGEATLGAMFPLTMIPTGAISSADASDFGQAAGDAATSFQNYLTQNGVTATQMSAFQTNLLAAMRTYAAANQQVADQTDPSTAAGLFGKASAQFLAAMIQAGNNAGIDPSLITAAFDQAGQTIDNSTALANVPSQEIAAMRTAFLMGAQQRQLQAQMLRYAAAMPVVGATQTQTQTFTNAMSSLQNTMIQARQSFFQQAFADPTTLPDQTTLDQAASAMESAMQSAFGNFQQATTATSTQIGDMLNVMATGMGQFMGGGMMGGGGMMTGSALGGLGFGMMQTTLGGTTQNWSTMMVAASNIVASAPDLNYTPATADLISQLPAADVPTAPDWSQLPDGPYKSLLELQYDLMLVHLIDVQAVSSLTPPISQTDLAQIAVQDLKNRAEIRQGLQGISDAQITALMAALSPPQLLQGSQGA